MVAGSELAVVLDAGVAFDDAMPEAAMPGAGITGRRTCMRLTVCAGQRCISRQLGGKFAG